MSVHRDVYRSLVGALGPYCSSICDVGVYTLHLCVYMGAVGFSSKYWVCMVVLVVYYTGCWGLAYMCTHRCVQVFSSSPGSVS